jgi:hypothetical protein
MGMSRRRRPAALLHGLEAPYEAMHLGNRGLTRGPMLVSQGPCFRLSFASSQHGVIEPVVHFAGCMYQCQ